MAKEELQEEAQNRAMINNIMAGMGRTEAYAKSRGKVVPTRGDRNRAEKALSQPETQALINEMRSVYVTRAAEAFEKQWDLADDPTTPPAVRNKIWSDVQDRAGLKPPEVSLNAHKHEHEHRFPDLAMNKQEIIDMVNEPESADEITKRNNR